MTRGPDCPDHRLHPRPAPDHPSHRLDEEGERDLSRLLGEAVSLGVLWSEARRPEVLRLAGRAAAGWARLYVLGPPDFGGCLPERAWLRRHAGRLRARRGAAGHEDLLVLRSVSSLQGVVVSEDPDGRPAWRRIHGEEAEAAAEWFSHLFWQHAAAEGAGDPARYRFRPPPDTPCTCPAPRPLR